jgi:NAD(P)-dependent dehydrogenase (short-subunit alcohol dehydrogenase family)
VAVNYQASLEAAKEVCGELRGRGTQCQMYQADVSQEEQAAELVERVRLDFSPVHILVNNAGITRDKSFLKMPQALWDEVINVNLNGPVNMVRKILPGMVEAAWGRIINVSSIVGQTGNFGQANYSAAKGAMIAFTKTLAREVARKGITVNAVAPGFIQTDMTRGMSQDSLDVVKAQTPVGRLGLPEEVAAAILFLALPTSSYVTGQVLAVNGGMYM